MRPAGALIGNLRAKGECACQAATTNCVGECARVGGCACKRARVCLDCVRTGLSVWSRKSFRNGGVDPPVPVLAKWEWGKWEWGKWERGKWERAKWERPK